MPCHLLSPDGSRRLVVRAFSTDLRSTMGSVQLRNHNSPHSRTVQQHSLQMLIQTKGPEDYASLVRFLRQSQLHSLNETGKTRLPWPERDMAYEVYIDTVPNARRLTDVAPRLQLTMGLITNLINTSTGVITGEDSSRYGNWLDTKIPLENNPKQTSPGGMIESIR